MSLKNLFKKINETNSKKSNNKEIEFEDSYCYSSIIWNTRHNLIILLSFTEDYFNNIIELQDAINHTGLSSKVVYSSYDEDTGKVDEDGSKIILIHNKYYLLIGGKPHSWNNLYMCINNLSNKALNIITTEIVNNCSSTDFNALIQDGILYGFKYNKVNGKYDNPASMAKTTEDNIFSYTDPEVLLNRLPSGFIGRDLLRFIMIEIDNTEETYIALNDYLAIAMKSKKFEERFVNDPVYSIFKVLLKNCTIDKIKLLKEALYKQPDDDSFPGDVDDESLDSIFREHYERFSAVSDDSILYEDIDEALADDEESENMKPEDIIDDIG